MLYNIDQSLVKLGITKFCSAITESPSDTHMIINVTSADGVEYAVRVELKDLVKRDFSEQQREYLLASGEEKSALLSLPNTREIINTITVDFVHDLWFSIQVREIEDHNQQQLSIFKLFLELSKDISNITFFNRFGGADIYDYLDEVKDEIKEWM